MSHRSSTGNPPAGDPPSDDPPAADPPAHGFWTTSASTRPDHPDPRLRGRRYAIPFQRVWTEAVGLISNRSRSWTLIEADDQNGLIRAEAKTLVLRFVDDVEIHVSLDADAQTRVDVSSRSRQGKTDFGTNARRIRRYLRRLDRGLGAGPGVILPPEEGSLPAFGR